MRTGTGTIILGQFHRVLFRPLNFQSIGDRLYPRDVHVPYRLWNIFEFLRNEAENRSECHAAGINVPICVLRMRGNDIP